MSEARICMVCGNSDTFYGGEFTCCADCGSKDIVWESSFPIVRGNEYPTFEEMRELRKEGKL